MLKEILLRARMELQFFDTVGGRMSVVLQYFESRRLAYHLIWILDFKFPYEASYVSGTQCTHAKGCYSYWFFSYLKDLLCIFINFCDSTLRVLHSTALSTPSITPSDKLSGTATIKPLSSYI